uniref:Uncharacterized protein n=1 Tax=Ananas comosus var. bracteatus TaxID=296719 RepID=A0A6V7P8D9_ANACO|nr:unnamed protein product [Ananas comosus var. bracteatus]
MSLSNPNPSHNPNPRITGLLKQRSWSPDSEREEAWLRRKGLYRDRRRGTLLRRSRSVTDEDLDELRGCFDLGFGFDPIAPAPPRSGSPRRSPPSISSTPYTGPTAEPPPPPTTTLPPPPRDPRRRPRTRPWGAPSRSSLQVIARRW